MSEIHQIFMLQRAFSRYTDSGPRFLLQVQKIVAFQMCQFLPIYLFLL